MKQIAENTVDAREGLAVGEYGVFSVAEVQRARERIAALEDENQRLQQWVNDLHKGMYINCVYCGHRYGPDTEVPATMADVLKQHIEQCPQHPMSALKRELAEERRDRQDADMRANETIIQLAEEKKRADSNYVSFERVRDKLSKVSSELARDRARSETQEHITTLVATAASELLLACRIVRRTAKHNKGDPPECIACVIEQAITRAEAVNLDAAIDAAKPAENHPRNG